MTREVTGIQHLAAEIEVFAEIAEELAAVVTRTHPDRRSELIKLRRRLSNQIGRLREVGVRAFADLALADEFRSRLSTVLTVVSLHQANWPAVAIDEGDASFRASAAAVRASNRAFIAWTRAVLKRSG